jgi:hypothetical protein
MLILDQTLFPLPDTYMKDTIPPLWHVPVVDKVRSNGTKSKAKLNQIWGVAQWLSIDVALGAICSCAMMYKVMGVTPLPGINC